MACPIWPEHRDHGSASQRIAYGASGAPRTATVVACPVCGEFEISIMASEELKRAVPDEIRWRLSWATRSASEAGAPLRLLSADLKRTAESVAEPQSPVEKADLLLKVLGSRTRALGERVGFDPKMGWPLIYARGEREAARLLTSLKRLDYLSFLADGSGIELTFKGWERLQALRLVPTVSTKVFVAMWFDPSMDPVFDDGIFPALQALGYDPIRVDREHFLGKIDDYIVKSIRESCMVVADFTGHRQGVYWEAGFGFGLGLPVVYTCRESEIGDAHFDTRQYNHVCWTDAADLARKIRERIEATITNRPKPRT